MFIIQPGQGLGFTGSREIAMALGGGDVVIDIPVEIGDGGHFKRPHGAFITEPGELPRSRKDLQRMAVMAILAINEYYD